jgi:hypothetical protein
MGKLFCRKFFEKADAFFPPGFNFKFSSTFLYILYHSIIPEILSFIYLKFKSFSGLIKLS